jgi:hypothetical protein
MNRSFLRGLSFALGLSLVGGLSFSSSDAFAKKKDKGSETEAEEVIEIVVTNIKAIDDVLAPAGAMLTNLKTAAKIPPTTTLKSKKKLVRTACAPFVSAAPPAATE